MNAPGATAVGATTTGATSPQRFAVGEIECTVLGDGGFDYPRHILDGVGEEHAARLLDGAAETFYMPYNALLVRTGGTTLLVDAGLGDLAHEMGAPAGKLAGALRDAGFGESEVGVVVLTHAHPDHIGGLSRSGTPAFPGARHVVSRVEWEYWMGTDDPGGLPPELAGLMTHTARTQLSVVDAAGLVDLVDRESEIAPGVWLVPAPGHTPGHTAVALESDGETALFCADAFLDDFHLGVPRWKPVVDGDPQEAVRTRLQLLDRAVAEGCLVAAYHMARRGHVERYGDAYRLAGA